LWLEDAVHFVEIVRERNIAGRSSFALPQSVTVRIHALRFFMGSQSFTSQCGSAFIWLMLDLIVEYVS